MKTTIPLYGDIRRQMRDRIILWLLLSFLLTVILLPGFYVGLPLLFSPSYIMETGAYPWAVLGLCILWLFLKRGEVARGAASRVSQGEKIAGAGVAGTALLLRNEAELSLLALGVLLVFLGLYISLFGLASHIPGVLVGVYAFSVLFPRVFTAYLEAPYSLTTVKTVASVVGLMGYPISAQGDLISFTSVTGERLGSQIGAPSSGIASITIFVALFALMHLDFRPPWRMALYLFLFGILGTTLQNILRLVLIILAGYHFGYEAMAMVHDYAGYVLFPLWYMAFVYIYMSFQPRNIKNKRNEGRSP
jgi:exosortase/archaeosortase family protein